MTAVAKTAHGTIRDPAFQRDINYYLNNMLPPLTPVSLLFASCLECNRQHDISRCETCYEQWKALT